MKTQAVSPLEYESPRDERSEEFVGWPLSDRRVSRRRRLAEVPRVTEIRARSETLEVVNMSRSGILIETGVRWLPGTSNLLEILRLDGSLRLRAEVVRCYVTGVAAHLLRFRVGIAFDRELDFIDEEEEGDGMLLGASRVPAADSHIVLATDLREADKVSLEDLLVENGW